MNVRQAAILAIVLLGSTGCGDDADPPEDAVTISFAVAANGVDWQCGESLTLGTGDTPFELSDARFYVHDVALMADDGASTPLATRDDGIWSLNGVTLLDFEDGTGPCTSGNSGINTTVAGSVPSGSYTGLQFTLGIPLDENHQDAAVAEPPFSYSAMFWSWQAGYKFLRLDGETEAGNGNRIHLGSTGCEGSVTNVTGCSHENRSVIELPAFDPATDTVVLDLAQLFASVDLETNTENTPLGCMSTLGDPDCVPLFDALGLGDDEQTAFRVRR